MKDQNYLWQKYLLLSFFSVFLFTACGKAVESPEVVLDKAKQALVEVESGKVEVAVSVDGSSVEDDLDFTGMMTLMFDKKDEANQKVDLGLKLSGKLTAGEQSLDGDLDFSFITLDKQFYVKLSELSSSDPNVAAMEPFVNMYKGKWLRIAEDFIPENIRDFQEQDEAVLLKKQQLEDLFVDIKLFDVVKEYGIEKHNGRSVHHYGLAVNLDGFKDYMTKAAIIDGRELTQQEIEEALQVLGYLRGAEIYVDTSDYYVLKSVFRFSGEALNSNSSLEVELSMEGSEYDESLSISAPEGAEDFNPLNLIMGLGSVPLPTGEEAASLSPEEAALMEEIMKEAMEEEVEATE